MKLSWITDDPVRVAQWPMSNEKIQGLTSLVDEQLKLGHLKPSSSPWNTPVFVIQKKSAKWRLLHDLRAVNEQMLPFGALQPGIPSPALVYSHFPVFYWKTIHLSSYTCMKVFSIII